MTIPDSDGMNEQLSAIAEAIWSYTTDHNVYLCLAEGLPVKGLPDLSPDRAQRDVAFAREMIGALDELSVEQLNYGNQVTWSVLHWDMEQQARALDVYWHQFAITPYSVPFWIVNLVFSSWDFQTAEDADRFLELASSYRSMLDSVLAKTQGQAERGIIIPREEFGLVIPLLESYYREPDDHFLSVDEQRLAALPRSAANTFRQHLNQIITEQINPGFRALIDYLEGSYRDRAPEQVGLGQYAGGLQAYQLLMQHHTTLPLSLEDIHEMGLAAVEEINVEMAKIRRRIGFEGTKKDFHHFLKTDGRFFAQTPDEVSSRLMAYITRLEPIIGSVFSRLPEAPYGVKRLDPELEGSMTFGYYDLPKQNEPVGYYRFNGSQLDRRSLYNAGGLIYHELVPGHHFHIARQRENMALPDVRRLSMHSAYTEGWAEYAADLAGDLGMYSDPYDAYGRLAMTMFLSSRLVVDPGMNALGWSREQAADFMMENCLESETQIYTETLRYSVDMPGQALAYKIGSIKMHELRRKAEKALGDRFDIRQYHEAVLEHGSMPLELLEKHLDHFIQLSLG